MNSNWKKGRNSARIGKSVASPCNIIILFILLVSSLQYISEANFTLHELRCAKHTVLCEVCGEPVSKEEIEQHLQEEHAPVECQHCGKKFPREQIDHHRVS